MSTKEGFLYSGCGCYFKGSPDTEISALGFCDKHHDMLHQAGSSKESMVRRWLDIILRFNAKFGAQPLLDMTQEERDRHWEETVQEYDRR
jgi:hypothetical protein